MSFIQYVNPDQQKMIDQLQNITESDAKAIVDYYISMGVRSTFVMGGLFFGIFQYWYYNSLKTVAKNQRELEVIYMGQEIVAPRPSDPAI